MDRYPDTRRDGASSPLAAVRKAFVDTLIRSIESDRFPSINQMEFVEALMSAEQRQRYIRALIGKIQNDYPHASVPLMLRVVQLVSD